MEIAAVLEDHDFLLRGACPRQRLQELVDGQALHGLEEVHRPVHATLFEGLVEGVIRQLFSCRELAEALDDLVRPFREQRLPGLHDRLNDARPEFVIGDLIELRAIDLLHQLVVADEDRHHVGRAPLAKDRQRAVGFAVDVLQRDEDHVLERQRLPDLRALVAPFELHHFDAVGHRRQVLVDREVLAGHDGCRRRHALHPALLARWISLLADPGMAVVGDGVQMERHAVLGERRFECPRLGAWWLLLLFLRRGDGRLLWRSDDRFLWRADDGFLWTRGAGGFAGGPGF